MQGIFVDMANELADLGKEVDLLSRAVAILEEGPSDDPAWTWLAVQGLASGIEKIYTGCERIMAMVATSVDGARVARDEGWHSALLKRMAHPFPGVRDRVISETTYDMLDRLRSFRHRERNSYGLTLDAGIVVDRARETDATFRRFRADVEVFAAGR